MLFSQNGVIKKAREAAEKTQIAQVTEKLELAKTAAYMNEDFKFDLDDYFQSLEDEGIIGDKGTDIVDNGDGTYEITTDDGYIFEITVVPNKDNPEGVDIEYSGKVDGPRIRKINVTKTTNSISVKIETVNAEGATYTYYYKKDSESEWIKVEENKENTYTFSGLEANVIYNIKVVVEKDGKTAEKEISTITGELPEGAVQFGTVTWSNGQASTIITTTETGYTLQYQIGGIEENNWTNITSGTRIENLQHGTTVYGRLFDGTNGSKNASIDIKDEINPTIVVTEGTITTNSISVNVQATDNESEMTDTPTYTYYIKKNGEADSSYTSPTGATGITQNTYTFTGLTQGTSYDVKVEVNGDKAGNTGTGILSNKTTGTIGEATGGLVEGNIVATNPTWSNGKASIALSTSTGLTIQYQVNGIDDGNWTTGTSVTGLNHNDTVYARLTDGTNYGDEASVSITDKTAPTVTVTKGTITTNSIAVSVSSKDNQWGMPTSPTYKYYIKKHTDRSYPTTASYTGTNTSYTFTGLTQGTSYDVRVTTIDKANNTGTGTLANQTTGEIGGATGGLIEGNIIASNPTWSGGKASITLSTSTGLTIQYQVNGIDDGNWTTGTSVTGLNHNDTVYARLTDGTNYGDEASVSITDKTAPTVTVTKGTITTNSISVSVSSKDNQWGMSTSPTYKYYIKKHTDGSYPTTASYTGTNTSYTFTGLTQGTSYDVRVTTVDKANNTGTGTLANQTTEEIGGATGGLVTGNIIASNPTWSGGKASITLSTSTGLTIQYQVNGINDGKWITGTSVTGLNHNDTVYARLTDGTNYGDEASVTIKDGTVPTISNIIISNITQNSITVTVTASDGESGILNSILVNPSTGEKVAGYQYYLNDESEPVYSTGNSYTFEDLNPVTQYTIKVEVRDNAMNVASKTAVAKTEESKTVENTLEEGDYVNYVDRNGTTRQCVVLYGPENENYSKYGIQIITMKTTGSVTLDNGNGAGTTSETNNVENFEIAMNSYNNAISILNNEANKYLNSNYASLARCVGSKPDNPTVDTDTYFDGITFLTEYNGKFKNGDTNYLTDLNQMKSLGIAQIGQSYFLASRRVISNTSNVVFRMYYCNSTYLPGTSSVCWIYSGGTIKSGGRSFGFRPVFKLKSGIKVTGGEGTESNPYILGI